MNTDNNQIDGYENNSAQCEESQGNGYFATNIMQFIRYAIVGVMNTLLTLLVIYICKSYFDINPYVSNAIGYGCGLINSFLWNRTWVFKAADGKIHHQAVKFLCGFAVCYAIQFGVVWVLNQSQFGQVEVSFWGFTLSGYGMATIFGSVVYTLCNFIYNRVIAFR